MHYQENKIVCFIEPAHVVFGTRKKLCLFIYKSASRIESLCK